jgi:hypothetical protein
MSRKCDWCGRYHDERFIYNYYRDSNGRYRSYDFCSTACKFYFNNKTNLTKVDHNGFTPSEEIIEIKKKNQEIKDRYGSWENYQSIQKQTQKENNLRTLRNKLFLWLFCPLILFFLFKMGMSFLPLTFFSVFWFITLAKNSD